MKNEDRFSRQLQELLKDGEKLDKANEYLDLLIGSLRSGHDDQKIRKLHGKGPLMFEGALEVAKSRISVSGKFSMWNRLWLDTYSASYSTPQNVAEYRAGRLASSELVDVGCGAGMQTVFFSRTCSVTGIEVSPLRALMARLNSNAYGFHPKKIINSDYANVIENLDIDSETVIFSDPLRPRTEAERTLNTLIPSPNVLIKLLSKKTGKFVFDLPPQISWDNLPLEGEKEYISIDGLLNRLTLYQGKLKNFEASAVIMPNSIRISGNPSDAGFEQSETPKRYLYVPDIALIYSKLLYRIKRAGSFYLLSKDRRRTVLTGDGEPDYYFPGEVFNVLGTADSVDLLEKLKELDCGKVVLRYSLDPDKYYKTRKEIEANLSGDVELYIFQKDGRYILCSKERSNADKPLDKEIMESIS